jgi:hypothetical protein
MHQYQREIVVLTDGEDNASRTSTLETTRRLFQERGYQRASISVIGVQVGSFAAQLQDICAPAHCQYLNASNNTEIADAFNRLTERLRARNQAQVIINNVVSQFQN